MLLGAPIVNEAGVFTFPALYLKQVAEVGNTNFRAYSLNVRKL
jgi:hypothetical protein